MSKNFDNNVRRRAILIRNSRLVFIGYLITQSAALLAHELRLSSILYKEIVFVAAVTLCSSVLFSIIVLRKREMTNRFTQIFHFGQYLIWLIMYAVWLFTLREIRVAALFFALMPLSFLLSDTKMIQSLIVTISAMIIQVTASYFAIFVFGQTGSFKLEVFYTLCFAPAALFLCYLSNRFSQQRDEVKVAKRVAEETRDALAIEITKTQKANAELHQALDQIEKMARVDALTGVFNRRHLIEALEMAKKKALRSGTVFSIVMVDIDLFKDVNDTYGHLSGDAVLKGIATTLSETLRETDLCARFGGEEFMLLMEQTRIGQAGICAERLRALIEQQRFDGFAEDFTVTASMGVAEFQNLEAVSETISRADNALYRAKAAGRNRVELG